MSEPKRWLDDGASEVVERLLAAASCEQPSQASLARTFAALGVGVSAVSTAGVAGAAAPSVGGAGLAGAAKGSTLAGVLVLKGTLLGVGLGATFVVVNVVAFSRPQLSQPGSTLAPPMTSSFHAVRSQPLSTASAVQVPELTAKSARPLLPRPGPGSAIPGNESPTGASAPIDIEQLAEEVRAVDRARSALEAGRASAALAALDGYEARFPGRRFAPEVLYLRVEALLRLGRLSEARTLAEKLVMSYPNSPQAERARQVLSRSIP